MGGSILALFNRSSIVNSSCEISGGAIATFGGRVTLAPGSLVIRLRARLNGGALYMLRSVVTIAESLIADSAAEGGGGFAHADDASLTVTDNTQIFNATTRLRGGAIRLTTGSEATLAN
eukprot:685429-Prymnesium_polylepis.1